MTEPQLVFELAAAMFNTPATFGRSNVAFKARRWGKVAERVCGWLGHVLRPFRHEPTGGQRFLAGRELGRRSHTPRRKAPRHFAFRPLAPRHVAEVGCAGERPLAEAEGLCPGADLARPTWWPPASRRLRNASQVRVGCDHFQGRVDPHTVGPAVSRQLLAKRRHRAEQAVGQDRVAEAAVPRPAQHRQRQLPLGLVGDFARHAGLIAPRAVVGPGLGQIQPGVEPQHSATGRQPQRDRDLTTGDLASTAGRRRPIAFPAWGSPCRR